MNRPAWVLRLGALAASLACTLPVLAAPTRVLFVGNSFTFGRVDPVMRYNAANVHDLTAGFYAEEKAGTNPWEPHPWGGVPGLFKAMTVEAGLDVDVSISARNAASLRLHFVNPNPAWDLRGNVASQRWDVVVLQEQSDGALPPGKGKNADPAQFTDYANRFERFIHDGAAQTLPDGTKVPPNPNASAATRIYLTDTWARPDMVFAHRRTRPDRASPTGEPRVDDRAGEATLYYPSLAAMTADLHAAFAAAVTANPNFAGVIPVGDAFQAACDEGVAKQSGFYGPDGAFTRPAPGEPMNLWWDDGLHASKYGSYLDALVQFGVLTGRDPASFGASESVAKDLGIAAADAVQLQRIASARLGSGAAGK